MPSLRELELFRRLEHSQRVLIAGAGGGFDVYAGLPIALALANAGKTFSLANHTFSTLSASNARWLAPGLAVVTSNVEGDARYFPERTLARWLSARGMADEVFALEKLGVRTLRRAYERLCDHVKCDAIVLVDGGTDILMRGDEAGLGTPAEDMTSLAAVGGLCGIPTRLVACIGFGIDAFHGVCHAQFLENVAALEREGGYLGAFSVSRSSDEGSAFLDAVAHAQAATRERPSIVNGSIAAAVRGEFGNAQFTDRTEGSELFINPLMALYFAFDLPAVARQSLYLSELEDTETIWDVQARIEAFRRGVHVRPRRVIPV